MQNYYNYCCKDTNVFETLPLTFHVKTGLEDKKFKEFEAQYEADQKVIDQANTGNKKVMKNIWIIKPGENSNRGVGIVVENKYKNI